MFEEIKIRSDKKNANADINEMIKYKSEMLELLKVIDKFEKEGLDLKSKMEITLNKNALC